MPAVSVARTVTLLPLTVEGSIVAAIVEAIVFWATVRAPDTATPMVDTATETLADTAVAVIVEAWLAVTATAPVAATVESMISARTVSRISLTATEPAMADRHAGRRARSDRHGEGGGHRRGDDGGGRRGPDGGGPTGGDGGVLDRSP